VDSPGLGHFILGMWRLYSGIRETCDLGSSFRETSHRSECRMCISAKTLWRVRFRVTLKEAERHIKSVPLDMTPHCSCLCLGRS
jgi:hypothetical protein